MQCLEVGRDGDEAAFWSGLRRVVSGLPCYRPQLQAGDPVVVNLEDTLRIEPAFARPLVDQELGQRDNCCPLRPIEGSQTFVVPATMPEMTSWATSSS